MISVFGFNVPERAGINSLDPHMILKRRRAKGEINEEEYNKISAQLRNNEVGALQGIAAQTTRVSFFTA